MNVRHFFLIAASITVLGGVLLGQSSLAQEPALPSDNEVDRIPLFDSLEQPATSNESDVRNSKMSVAQLRQARALHRANQRVARLEYNLWMGYEPLRPNWNALPMMTSRYPNRKIYVPVYVRTR